MNQSFDYNAQPENQQFSGFDNVPPAPESRAYKGFSIAALVLGIASVAGVCCCCCCGLFFLPLICGVLAIVFAVIAARKAPDKKMPGMAIAGLILGIIGVLLTLVFFAFLLAVPPTTDAEFWAEYEEILREELGDELFEEYFGDAFPAEPLE